jgi:hypothetical protein
MSPFDVLPSEMITMVFKKLDHLDDARNLANSCRRFKAHMVARNDMLRVTRAILVPLHDSVLSPSAMC